MLFLDWVLQKKISEQKLKEINLLTKYIQTYTKPQEYIFVNYYAPFIYFLVDRNNPTRYDFVSSNELPLMYQKQIVKTIQKKNVKFIVTHAFVENEDSLVTNYIKKDYHIGTVDELALEFRM